MITETPSNLVETWNLRTNYLLQNYIFEEYEPVMSYRHVMIGKPNDSKPIIELFVSSSMLRLSKLARKSGKIQGLSKKD